ARPAAGEVQVRIKAVALNHLDLWGYRGMAFAKRKMPVVVGVEASGEIAALGPDSAFKVGDPVVLYGALTCGHCKACREGRDNLCENVGGIMGFHIDGFARDLLNMPARLAIPVPKGVDVVFEHVGAETFNGSLLCLKRGGRLVTCGATSGPSTTLNLMQLFQQQYRIIGSFGASMRNIRESLAKMAAGMLPVIDGEFALSDFEQALARLESRQVFGKIVIRL